MNLCDHCLEGVHQVAREDDLTCDCGCHQVLVLAEYDKVVWWLPAGPEMGYAIKVREKPVPSVILNYFYREPRPGGPGPWVESGDEVKLFEEAS